jgi:RNA polymerase sigma factor (sigma-70 family)
MTMQEAVLPADLAPVYAEKMSDADDARFSADLEAARNGDQEAFGRLIEPLQGKLYGYIRKAMNFSADADDVFQETVLRAFRFLPAFRPGSFAVWLFAIAHNEARRFQGRNARRRNEPLDPSNAAPVVDPAQTTLVDEVYAVAVRLPERGRRVFFLFYDSGFSVAEIAAITGLSRANVKFLLFRARRLVRAELGEIDEQP